MLVFISFPYGTELWTIFHDQLDLDGNGHVDAQELTEALHKAGVQLNSAQLSDFMTYLTSSPHSHAISFPEFRDFLLLLPRKASTVEMYRYYEVRKFLGDDGHGVARVNMEGIPRANTALENPTLMLSLKSPPGDVTLSAEDRHPLLSTAAAAPETYTAPHQGDVHAEDDLPQSFLTMVGHSQAFRFLLAGGLAGAVSRTATAPFDRLKVFLITRAPEVLKVGDAPVPGQSARGLKAIFDGISTIHSEQGLRGFWVGNGLNVVKIFPVRTPMA